MKRLLRKLLILMIVGAGGAALFRASRRRSSAASSEPIGPSTEWPPFENRSNPADAQHTGARDGAVGVADAGAAKTGAVGFVAAAAAKSHVAEHAAADEPPAEWVAPVDGVCPSDYPIKANDNSHIYHVPGGRFYDRTAPERCYASEDAAQRDGYRRAKA